jgi:hypothetical protein
MTIDRKEPPMPRYEFQREFRSASSESFLIEADGSVAGRVELHYGLDVAHATVCLPDGTSEDEIQELIGEIDERLVMTAHPFREDFVATVWLGRQAGVYSEEFDEELEDEEIEGNGHHQ